MDGENKILFSEENFDDPFELDICTHSTFEEEDFFYTQDDMCPDDPDGPTFSRLFCCP